jgi:hypothetical protein
MGFTLPDGTQPPNPPRPVPWPRNVSETEITGKIRQYLLVFGNLVKYSKGIGDIEVVFKPKERVNITDFKLYGNYNPVMKEAQSEIKISVQKARSYSMYLWIMADIDTEINLNDVLDLAGLSDETALVWVEII